MYPKPGFWKCLEEIGLRHIAPGFSHTNFEQESHHIFPKFDRQYWFNLPYEPIFQLIPGSGYPTICFQEFVHASWQIIKFCFNIFRLGRKLFFLTTFDKRSIRSHTNVISRAHIWTYTSLANFNTHLKNEHFSSTTQATYNNKSKKWMYGKNNNAPI